MRMKHIFGKIMAFAVLAALAVSNISLDAAFGSASLTHQTHTVSTRGGDKTVQAVWADLNDPHIKIQNVIAGNMLRNAAPLSTIAESVRTPAAGELAAINGSFFDPAGPTYGGSNVFYGIIENAGNYIKTGGCEYVMGFDPANQVKMGRLGNPVISLTREGDAANYLAPLGVWAINHSFNDPDEENIIYTSYYGNATSDNSRISVVVRNGVVTEVVNGTGVIHADGFTLVHSGKYRTYKVGDRVSYSIDYTDPSWSQYSTKIAGAPIIVENGQIRTDYVEQGYSEAKITTNSTPRSFIGVTADNKLVMGTVANASTIELAEIALGLGAVNALNLDGGASSGMYYSGSYITPPGRDLATVIVITDTNASATPPA